MNVIAFLVAAGFIPGLYSAAIAPRWAVFSLAWFCAGRQRMTALHWISLGFLAWAAFSVLWSPIPWDWAGQMWKFALMAGAFCAGASARSFERMHLGFILGVLLSIVPLIAQIVGLWPIQEVATPSGLFVNRNSLAEAASLALVMSLPLAYGCAYQPEQSLWRLLLPFGVAFCLWVTHSRAAIGALLIVGCTWLWNVSKAAVLIIVIAIGVFIVYDFQNPWRDESLNMRLNIWQDTLAGVSFLGNGAGQFYALYPRDATRVRVEVERPEQSHSDPLQVLYEYGIPGFVLFCAFWFVAFRCAGPLDRTLLGILALESLVAFPLQNPATAFVAAFVAGSATRNLPEFRWAEFIRRNHWLTSFQWASLGTWRTQARTADGADA